MKNIIKAFLLFPLTLTLFSCGGVKKEDQEYADQVASCGAIATISLGRSGSQVMFTEDYSPNDIYKPYNPAPGSGDVPIYQATMLLCVWFKFETSDERKATLSWEFDHPEYVNYILPSSDNLPRATATIKQYPEKGGQLDLHMTATVKYNNATSKAKYYVRILNVSK